MLSALQFRLRTAEPLQQQQQQAAADHKDKEVAALTAEVAELCAQLAALNAGPGASPLGCDAEHCPANIIAAPFLG